MKRAARAALILAPLMVASMFAAAGPAWAGGSPDVCVWPGTGGVQAVGFGEGATVVVNNFQFTCQNAGFDNLQWEPNGTTSDPDTPNLQQNYDPSLNPGNYSTGVVLVDSNGDAMQDYGDFWNDGGPWSDYGQYGDVGGGSGVGPGGLQQ